MKAIAFYFMLASGILFSCDSKDDCCEYTQKTYLRSWLLAESGYSAGNGYIVEPVDPFPPRILTLHENGEVTSNLDELNDYKYYKFMAGSSDNDVIMFYKTKSERDSSINDISYTIVFGEGFLKLTYHYCFEGCHLGFVPVK